MAGNDSEIIMVNFQRSNEKKFFFAFLPIFIFFLVYHFLVWLFKVILHESGSNSTKIQ